MSEQQAQDLPLLKVIAVVILVLIMYMMRSMSIIHVR